MQLVEVLSRNVVKVHEPAGKGLVVDGAEVVDGDVEGDAADEELQVRVNGMDAEVRDFDYASVRFGRIRTCWISCADLLRGRRRGL